MLPLRLPVTDAPEPEELDMNDQIRTDSAVGTPSARGVDMKFEIVVIPVSDVDRAKEFYGAWAGGSTPTSPATAVPRDPVHAARLRLLGHLWRKRHRGGARLGPGPVSDRLRYRGRPRRAARPRRRGQRSRSMAPGTGMSARTSPICSAGSASTARIPRAAATAAFASFSDPDGNGWLFQEITARLPGRVKGSTSFGSSAELAAALRRAEAAHGEHEKRIGGSAMPNWPDWYAEYMVREQAGETLPN
jgi:catechol 2,3-dioxygenase-like lactoylglutathione lyase family enzyme